MNMIPVFNNSCVLCVFALILYMQLNIKKAGYNPACNMCYEGTCFIEFR